jgi:hypothetical protein
MHPSANARPRMFVCMYVCMCVCMYIYIYIYIYIICNLCVCVRVCVCVCVSVCVSVCVCAYACSYASECKCESSENFQHFVLGSMAEADLPSHQKYGCFFDSLAARERYVHVCGGLEFVCVCVCVCVCAYIYVCMNV